MKIISHSFVALPVVIALAGGLLSTSVMAQQAQAQASAVVSLKDKIRAALADAGHSLEQKRYSEAADAYRKAFELDAYDASAAYNAACAYALGGKTEQAFLWLRKSIDAGYTDIPHMREDSDLATLRPDGRFDALMEQAKKEKGRRDRLWDSGVWNSAYQEQLTEDQRIAGLSRLWSEVKYNFVFTDRLLDLDWDTVYLRYLPKVRAAKDTKTYYQLLMEMTALLQDGHTGVFFPDALFNTAMAVPPFMTQLIDGKVVVTAVFDDDLRAQGIRPGVVITSVNGQTSDAYAKQYLAPLASASTPQNLEMRIYQQMFLAGEIAEQPLVGFSDSHDSNRVLSIKRIAFNERNARLKQLPYEFHMLPGNVAYVALNSFGSDEALSSYLRDFSRISQAKAIIFDIRKNGGGDTSVGYGILKTLSDQAFAGSHSETRDYKPTYRAWGMPPAMMSFDDSTVPPDLKHQYKGQVLVLTAARTFSAAEDFAVAFDTMKRGKLVGEATGGSTGQPLMISLPGGGSARICTKKDSYADGKAFVGVGVLPDIPVRPTLADFRAGKDTVLNAALKQVQ